MTLRDSEASHFPSPVPIFFFFLCSCLLDGISQLARIIIHNTGVSLWQCINWNTYPYLLYPPSIHMLSLSRYLFIAESAGAAILLLLETTKMVSIFSFSFTLSLSLSISNVLFLPNPPFVLSLHQGIILSAEVYTHRYPLCSTFLSALLSLCPSMISWVLPLISSCYSISTETKSCLRW